MKRGFIDWGFGESQELPNQWGVAIALQGVGYMVSIGYIDDK
jgi:hypothetical protein